MSDGLNIFENETQALGMHSDTHSQWSENPGSRDRNPLRAQDHHKAKMGDPVWSFEENPQACFESKTLFVSPFRERATRH
jgi:hypothetical protein